MSLLMLDVDHFTFFNDSYGHQVGDDCLRAVAAVVRETVRASDIACRYGGEEISDAIALRRPRSPPQAADMTRHRVPSLRQAVSLRGASPRRSRRNAKPSGLAMR